MVMRGCNAAGELYNSDYSKPLPWIGLYIAAASLALGVAMAFDAYSGFRRRRRWFPPRLFSLNSVTLTLLGVATKLPVDLNTSMPQRTDQLSKLSGTVLICIATANFVSSLGTMDDSDVLSNVAALGILVVTVVVNICMQLATGVIYVFLPEHTIVMFLMMVLLVLLISSALTVPTTRRLLEQQYIFRHHQTLAKDETGGGARHGNYSLEKLKEHLERYWLMAHTACPQYGRLETGTASGAFCLIGMLVLMEALLRAFFVRGSNLRFCSGESDYRWSTAVVLVVQVAAVLIGTAAPTYRWLYTGYFRHLKQRRYRDVLVVEKYWVHGVEKWKAAPIPFRLSSVWGWKVAHLLKNSVMSVLLRLQLGVVLASKIGGAVSFLICYLFRMCALYLSPSWDWHFEWLPISAYVLRLEGEGDWVGMIMYLESRDEAKLLETGRKNPPKVLFELIRDRFTIFQGFKEVGAFDSAPGVPSLCPEEPPNCWALPVVTLAAIAVALPGVDNSLLQGVSEGLRFVRLIEVHLDEKGLANMREAADIVWLSVNLNRRWLDWELRSLVPTDNINGKQIVEATAEIAEHEVTEFLGKIKEELRKIQERLREGVVVPGLDSRQRDLEHLLGDTCAWPEKVLAANCMYRVCKTILHGYDTGKHQTDVDLFAWLRTTISDILGACLTNLPHALYLECFSQRIGGREKCVRDAALALGEAEAILELLESPQVTACLPSSTQYIDDWRNRGSITYIFY